MKIICALRDFRPGPLVQEEAALEVEFIGFRICCVLVDGSISITLREFHLNLLRNGSAQFVLQCQKATSFPVIIVRPEMGLILHSNQLSADASRSALMPDAALQDVIDS